MYAACTLVHSSAPSPLYPRLHHHKVYHGGEDNCASFHTISAHVVFREYTHARQHADCNVGNHYDVCISVTDVSGPSSTCILSRPACCCAASWPCTASWKIDYLVAITASHIDDFLFCSAPVDVPGGPLISVLLRRQVQLTCRLRPVPRDDFVACDCAQQQQQQLREIPRR